jgi:WD40 repeat protein
MKKNSILLFSIGVLFLSIMAGCAPGAAEKAVMQTQTAEIAAQPVAPVQPVDNPTPTLLPTKVPTTAPSILSSQAAELCDAAFASAVVEGDASAPLLTMSNNYYDEANPSGWALTDSSELKHPATEARSADEVQTVVCVEEHRDLVTTYTDGAGGYMIRWLVRVVRWDDGAVVAEEGFYGEEPSQMKVGGGDHYGFSPAKQYREWLLNLFAEDSIFVQGTGVSNLALSPDGQYLVVTGSDFSAKVWDIAQHEPVFEQSGETNVLSSFLPVVFSPDKLHMAMVYLGGMNIMSVGSWNTIAQIDGIDIWSADFTEDGSLLAAGLGWSYDGVRIYDTTSGEQVNNFTLDTPVNRILFSPGDRYLIASAYGCDTCANGQSNGIYVWDFQSGTQVTHIEGLQIQDLVLLGDGNVLAVAVAKENDIRLYDITSGEQSGTLRGHEAMVMAMAATPNGNLLASADSNGTIILWNVATGQIDQKADGYDSISALAFSADGNTLAVGSNNATVELWNIQ